MYYAGNAQVYFKHQMLLSSLFLIWEEGNMQTELLEEHSDDSACNVRRSWRSETDYRLVG